MHDLNSAEGTPFVCVFLVGGELRVGLDEFLDFFFNHAHICAEIVSGEPDLDKLLLLHEKFVGDVIDDAFAENRGCQVLMASSEEMWLRGINTHCVCIFCAENGRFPTEDKIVALGAHSNRDTTTDENEGEHVAILKEMVRA